jgi:DNA-binding transcriptional ArsR family regulator
LGAAADPVTEPLEHRPSSGSVRLRLPADRSPVGLGQPTVGDHLKVLMQAGLVEREQRGAGAYFRVRDEPPAALRALLA